MVIVCYNKEKKIVRLKLYIVNGTCVDLLKKKYGDGVLTLTLKDQQEDIRNIRSSSKTGWGQKILSRLEKTIRDRQQ
uniref:hypothetical protein n=1 Tax=Phocaeicola sp. TaxID=2773926 RepID=UPI003AB57BEE